MSKIILDNVVKMIGDRTLFDSGVLEMNSGERLGIVGNNGSGKSSLLDIISGRNTEFEGDLSIQSLDKVCYFSSFEEDNPKAIGGYYSSIFNIPNVWSETMSGGEKSKFRLASVFESEPDILLLDEPTNNLDMDGIKLLTDILVKFKGILIIVSHDRYFLDIVCNKIIEIDQEKLNKYNGNYSKFEKLKEKEVEKNLQEYDEYVKEKDRLKKLRIKLNEQSNQVKRTPSRMGNSEARLHRMGGQNAKKHIDTFANSIDSRLDRLDVKSKYKEDETIKIDISEGSKVYSKSILSGKNLNKVFDKKIIFKDASFSLATGKKVALLGPNGVGKSTLIRMIMGEEDGIKLNGKAKIGYFNQDLDDLDLEKTVLENVMKTSEHDENFTRLVLSRLLFRGEKVHERAEVLSGGERVKVSLAKMVLSDVNFLILDEPTNYLDINSLKALEEIIVNFQGTVLLITHDRRFIENIAEEIMTIENGKIKIFKGNYGEYLEFKNKPAVDNVEKERNERIMLLENEVSTLIGQMSVEVSEKKKDEMDILYSEKLKELRELRSQKGI